MLSEKLKRIISNYPDFPKEGILFRDISPILANPIIFSQLIDIMSSSKIIQNADKIENHQTIVINNYGSENLNYNKKLYY